VTTAGDGSAQAPPRVLGVVDAALIVVGSMVGGGIFLASGEVARHVASPAGFLAVWAVGGAFALAGALCNGELGAMFPRSGGEYVYLREAYGAPIAFLSGWTSFWIGFPGSIAALAAGFGRIAGQPLGAEARTGTGVALGTVVVLTAVNAAGLRPGKWVQNTLSGVKLIVFALLLALGAFMGRGPAHLTPFFTGERAENLGLALVPVLFAYSGWNAATYVAGELRDPARTLGRALVVGTSLCIGLYLAVNAVYLRAMPLETMRGAADVSREAALRLGSAGIAAWLGPLAAVCILSSLQATILTGPRIYRAMAQDRLFVPALARLGTRSRAPAAALAVQAVIACALILTRSFEWLLTFVMFAIVLFSALTVAAVIVLRVRRPEIARSYRTPWVPFVPALFLAVSAWLLWSMLAAGMTEAFVGLGIVATGAPAYLVFQRRRRSMDRA
jgi:APA family basic amino acid/polyamine antiporter